MGFKARLCHRYVTEVQSAASREAVRKGFAAMWRHAPKLMRQFKIPRPGQFIKSNIFGGKLWGGYTEWHKNSVTALRMGRLFEACALNQACSDSVLCQISKTLSYLYLLETGEAKKNWKTLPGLKVTLAKRKRIREKQTVKPAHVPTAHLLAHAFTKEWRPGHDDMPLLKFLNRVVMAWDSHVTGCRPKVDLKKIKDSTTYWFGDDCWYTEFVDGRAKLPLEKSGTRPWRCWRVCLCEGGKHVGPDRAFIHSFDDQGNSSLDLSRYTTTCPVFAGQVLRKMQEHLCLPFVCYRKPLLDHGRLKKGRGLFGEENLGPVQQAVIEWLAFQGVSPVSSNSGRKCLAKWLSETDCPYHESVHVMGDLESVWRGSYQPDLAPSGFKIREQSITVEVATAALRRFRKLCGRAPPPPPPLPGMTKTDLALQMMCRNLGMGKSFAEIWKT